MKRSHVGRRFGLVIDGMAMNSIMHNASFKKEFLDIVSEGQGIIISRASPSQKASVVQFIKQNIISSNESTLSIGDGSNDVAMIQTAHIGVGLFGKEGSDAASNSDYAIAQFSHLRTLLFRHGSNIQYKMAYFTLMYLFKSQIFALVPFFFAFYSGFSG